MSKVAVIMGSQNDLRFMEKAVEVLDALEIPREVRVMSAHRTPELVAEFCGGLEKEGIRVVIAGAGGAAHLAGVVAAHTARPVIGVPLPSLMPDGMDALLATVQMPPGVPVATVGIGKAFNAGLLAAQMLSLADPALHDRVITLRKQRAEKVRAADAEVKAKFGG